MRVISGVARGCRLASPKGIDVRPTADRVKEALFSILISCCGTLDEMTVLDLFAGSGALGIEALSRGAAACTFVDSSRDSVNLVRKNLASTKFESQATVYCRDSFTALKALAASGQTFDLVFLDPPYGKETIPRTLALLSESLLLHGGSIIVVETASQEQLEPCYGRLSRFDSRRYGSTSIALFRAESDFVATH